MIALALLGVAALAGGLVLASRRRQDVVTTGRVLSVRSVREGGPVLVQHLAVAVRDLDGADVTVHVRSRSAVAPGTVVTVRYPRGGLARARVELLRADVVLLGGGAALLAAGLLPSPSGFLLVGGGLFGAIGGWVLRPMLGGVKVRGTVVRVDTRRDDDGDLLWRPVVRFLDRQENERVVEYDMWTSGKGPQVGAPQNLWYRPEDPSRVVLGSGLVLGGAAATTGAVLLAVALGLLVRHS